MSWADLGVVARSAGRLAQQVVLARPQPARPANVGPWPTQRTGEEEKGAVWSSPAPSAPPSVPPSSAVRPQSTPWPSKAGPRKPEAVADSEITASRTPERNMEAPPFAAKPDPAPARAAERAQEGPVQADTPRAASDAPAAKPATQNPERLESRASTPPDAAAPETRPPPADAPPSSGTSLAAPSALADDEYDAATEERATPLRAARVPSSRLGRILHYGSLGAGLAWGSAGEYWRRATGSGDAKSSSPFLSEANVNRLVDKLSTMRGAALKLGQFLSIQDSHMLPPQIEEVMLRVQNSAHYMPTWQLERVMSAELGSEWRSLFASFDERPFAAASIGQVHNAVLADPFPAQPEMAGQRVAVKVQFPGVAQSIASDLSNIKWLLMASSLLPKGLFMENSVRVLQKELEEECDYTREAEMGRRFYEHVQVSEAAPDALKLEVPRVVPSLCTPRVLTTEFMRGRPLTRVMQLDQATRDRIGHTIMDLSLRELFEWRLMQTDPNWTNFLYSERRESIQLIDFGATRPYTPEFMDAWISLLRAAVAGDREACEAWSLAIGYLNGQESEVRRDTHPDHAQGARRLHGRPRRALPRERPAAVPVREPDDHRPGARTDPGDAPRASASPAAGDLLAEPQAERRVPVVRATQRKRRLPRALQPDHAELRICQRHAHAAGARHLHAECGPRAGAAHPRGPPARRALQAQEPSCVVPAHAGLGRNLGDTWAHYPLDDMLAEKIAAADRADPNVDTSKPKKLEFVGRAASEPTLNFLSSEQIRPEAAGTVKVREIDVPLRPNPPGPDDCCMSGTWLC